MAQAANLLAISWRPREAVHAYAIAYLTGRPSADAIIDHRTNFLWNGHRDFPVRRIRRGRRIGPNNGLGPFRRPPSGADATEGILSWGGLGTGWWLTGLTCQRETHRESGTESRVWSVLKLGLGITSRFQVFQTSLLMRAG
jgi:hypothetical protein